MVGAKAGVHLLSVFDAFGGFVARENYSTSPLPNVERVLCGVLTVPASEILLHVIWGAVGMVDGVFKVAMTFNVNVDGLTSWGLDR